MRSGVLDLNDEYRDLLSNDLGAIGGLLFDIGSGRYPAPPLNEADGSDADWFKRLETAREEASTLSKAQLVQRESDRTHSEIQACTLRPTCSLSHQIAERPMFVHS